MKDEGYEEFLPLREKNSAELNQAELTWMSVCDIEMLTRVKAFGRST